MQVGDLDYVALSPPDRSVEDLSRHEVHTALQEKIPVDALEANRSESEAENPVEPPTDPLHRSEPPGAMAVSAEGGTVQSAEVTEPESPQQPEAPPEESSPETIADHARAVAGTGTVRILDDQVSTTATGDVSDARSMLDDAGAAAKTVLMDGTATQKHLDAAAEQAISTIYATDRGDIVKQPATVRIRSLEEF